MSLSSRFRRRKSDTPRGNRSAAIRKNRARRLSKKACNPTSQASVRFVSVSHRADMEHLATQIAAAINMRALYPANHPRVVQTIEQIVVGLNRNLQQAHV